MNKKLDLFAALAVLTIISIIVYVTARTILLFFVEYTLIESFFAVMLLLGEFFIILHTLGYVVNIARAGSGNKQVFSSGPTGLAEPSVAVLVAARHEPKEVLESTFITLYGLNYKNKTIYFLDDSSEDKYQKEAEELSKTYGLKLFRCRHRHGAKAGIINECLKTLNDKYVALFDADQNPLPDFLKVIIPLLEHDEKLGFIQTPQFYSNLDKGPIARGAAFQQAVFYEYICEGKSTGGSMFCCGTNVVFRRKALLDAGGLDESTVTEDFATSVKLHSRGWHSLYYNHVYAFGMGPESLTGYFKQQFRWALGTISVFKKMIWQLIRHPFSLSPAQWWEYFLSSSYYLIGVALLVMMLCPMVYLLFKVPSYFASPEIYFLVFLPYLILSMSVFYFLLRGRNYKIKDLFLGQLLGQITTTVYMHAALWALIGIRGKFAITEKTKAAAIPYIRLWPQILLIFFGFISVVWGLNRYIYEQEAAILVNSFWTLYNCLLLSSIFYFNREVK